MFSQYDKQLEDNTGLIYSQLHKLHLADQPDAVSLGFEALYDACKTYDENRGIQLSTYATVCIYNALGSYLRTLNKQRQLDVVSYHAMVNEEQDFSCLIPSDECVEGDVLKTELFKKVNEAIASLTIELLTDKHKEIFGVWHLSDFKMTTVEIARKVGVSQSYASHTLNILKFKLKKKLEGYYRA